MKNHTKFLKFNGKTLVFLSVDGTYWIALKPICEALNVQFVRSFKNLKKDPILAPALSKQTMQVSKNGKKQLRNVTCIPEYLIYGWLFSIKSKSPELLEYKKTCYQLLYNYFHGTITNRKELLLERTEIDTQIFEVKESLKTEDENYKHLQKLQSKRKNLSSQLNTIDKELIKQPELFN